jgi:bile acid:Na+ symporter, BASS family
MQKILKILNHRDFVLSLAIVAGMILGDRTEFLADISLYVLMLAMISSTISFSFKSWKKPADVLKPAGNAFLLSYGVFGIVTLGISWMLFHNNAGMEALWIGFVLLVAAPPGPAVLPFSSMLNGDRNYATAGLFGLYILAMFVTPAILFVFIGTSMISPLMIFLIMAQLIIIPLIASRFLRHPKVLPHAKKISGTFTKWMLFLVVTPIIGMNKDILIQEPRILVYAALVLVLSVFLLGWVYNLIMIKARAKKGFIISSTFMMVIKSSVFSAVVAFRFFEDEPVVAMPAAVMSVCIVLFAVLYSQFVKYKFKGYE